MHGENRQHALVVLNDFQFDENVPDNEFILGIPKLNNMTETEALLKETSYQND